MVKKILSMLLSVAMVIGLFVAPVNAETGASLNLINAPVASNGVFSNDYIYRNYLNTSLTSENSGAAYSWLANAKSDTTLSDNDVVSGIKAEANAGLNNGRALWCNPEYGYQVRLQDANLTYTLRFDLKDWYNVNRVDVFEVNYAEDSGTVTRGVKDIDISVGIRTDSMNAAEITVSSFLGDSAISGEHSTGKATINNFAKAIRGRYVDITFTVAEGAELQGVLIFGNKPNKTELHSIGGTVLSNGGKYGALDIYPQYLDAKVDILSSAATYTFEDYNTTLLTDGQVWFNPAWGKGIWADATQNYKILVDLKNTFEITRIDLHEIAAAAQNLSSWNFISSVSVAIGKSADNLTLAEFDFERKRLSEIDKNSGLDCDARANIVNLKKPVEGRFVELTITDGSTSACLSEINVFGNSVEKTDYNLISPNVLTDSDKKWYEAQYKMNIKTLGTDTTYRWAEFGLDNNTVAVKTAKLDDDYNGDGICGERNIADGNVTSAAAENIVPVSGVGSNAVIYDFGKKMVISRIDVHEFVKSGIGIGKITVKYGDKYGDVSATAKTVTPDASTETSLKHKNNIIELGTPVEAQFSTYLWKCGFAVQRI